MPFLTYETIFDVTQLPATMAVVGGGPIGAEIAQVGALLSADLRWHVPPPTLLATRAPWHLVVDDLPSACCLCLSPSRATHRAMSSSYPSLRLLAPIPQAYQRLGCQVTVVASTILPKEDKDGREVMAKVFVKEGIRHVVGRAASAVTEEGMIRLYVHAQPTTLQAEPCANARNSTYAPSLVAADVAALSAVAQHHQHRRGYCRRQIVRGRGTSPSDA